MAGRDVRHARLSDDTIAHEQHHRVIIHDQLVDVTAQHRRAGDDAVEAATQARDRISQAVEVIVSTHHLDATVAFDLLVSHPDPHTKLAVLAHRLIDELPRLRAGEPQRTLVDRLLHDAATGPIVPHPNSPTSEPIRIRTHPHPNLRMFSARKARP